MYSDANSCLDINVGSADIGMMFTLYRVVSSSIKMLRTLYLFNADGKSLLSMQRITISYGVINGSQP